MGFYFFPAKGPLEAVGLWCLCIITWVSLRLEVCLSTAESAVQVPSYKLSPCKQYRNTET